MKDIQDTMELAVHLHTGQYRKSKHSPIPLPYVFHSFEVVKLIWDWGIGTSVMIKAALGHDFLEHIDEYKLSLKEDDILAIVGEEAFAIIKELTFIPNSDFVAQSKQEYMKTFKDKSVHALVIKMADRFCNVEDFIVGNNDYASKYWCKAYDLFEAFDARREEIEKEFGDLSFGINQKIINTGVCIKKRWRKRFPWWKTISE